LDDKQSRQELEKMLFQILGRLTKPKRDYQDICAIIVDHAKRYTESTDGYIAMIDPETRELVVYDGGLSTDGSVPGCFTTRINPLSDGSYPGLRGYAITTGEPFYTNDPATHPSYRGFPADHIPVRNLISVPVRLETQIAGLIHLSNSNRDYDEDDIEVLNHISEFFAIVIKHWHCETLVRQQKSYLQALIDNSKDHIWAIDRNLRLTAINSQAKAEFERIDRREIKIGHRVLDDVPESLKTHWMRLYASAFEGFSLHLIECSEFTEYEYREFYVTPIGTDGVITGVSVHSQNVSDYVRSDKTIRALYRQLQMAHSIIDKVMNNIPAIILVVSLKTYRILYMNDFAKGVYGDVVGGICYEKCHIDKTAPCEECPVSDLVNSDIPVLARQSDFPVDDRWYLTSSSLIDWIDGDRAQLQIAIDITERLMAQQELERTTAQLKKLNATKDRFFSIIAHDLKSPFMGIFGFAEMIHDSCRNLSCDELETYSRIIANSARHTHDLLQNLLVWSQTQTDGIKFEAEPTDIKALIEECVASHHLCAIQKMISLESSVNVAHRVCVDGNLIRTIIRNLVSNAIKFTNPQAAVRINAGLEDHDLILKVSDDGEGMSPEQVQNLFAIDTGNSRSYNGNDDRKGTGLGLIICREFVMLHGGSISVNSKPGQGSVFTVRIPLHQDKEHQD